MSKTFPKSAITDLIEENAESFDVNGYTVRAVHSTMSEFHLAIYDDEDRLVGTLDGNRYSTVEDMWNDVRVQVGLERMDEGLGDLFT